MNTILKTIILAALLCVLPLAARTVADDEEDPYYLLTEQAGKAINTGDYEAAAARLIEAMSLRPDAPENVLLMSNLGLVYSYMDRDSLALATFDEALRRAPAMRTVLTNRARVLLKVGRDKDAYSDLARVIEADSANVEARYLHGLLAFGWGDDATAEADFEALRRADPDGLPTAVAMSTLLSARNRHREALPYLRRLVERTPQEEYYAALADCQLELGDLTAASETIAKAMELYPDSGEIYLCRARLNRDRYSLDEARSDAARARALGIDPRRIALLGL